MTEWQSTGLQASDLGKWSYLPAVIGDLPPTESSAVEAIQGGHDLFGDDPSPEADPIADTAHRLNKDRFTYDLNLRLAAAMADLSAGGDPATVAEKVTRAVASIKDGRVTHTGAHPLTNDLPGLFEKLGEGKSMVKPVPTGIVNLDAIIHGWQPTLNIIGADPGVGKSATLAKSAFAGARAGTKSVFFCLEDPPSFLSTRIISYIARIEVLRILYGKLSQDELKAVEAAFEELGKFSDNIIVYDGSERPMAVERLCATARSLVSTAGVQCVYIDHSGELSSASRDRHDLEVSQQLSLIRGLANTTGVPVVVAMHMRRRLNPKPTLADFANSAGAERKARLALALTREANAAVIQIHILKQTNGPSGITVEADFDLQSGMVA